MSVLRVSGYLDVEVNGKQVPSRLTGRVTGTVVPIDGGSLLGVGAKL